MLLGIQQTVAIRVTVFIFYAMDFLIIHRYDRQRQASVSGRAWNITRVAKQEEDLLTQSPRGYAEYAHWTPRFLPRVWRSR